MLRGFEVSRLLRLVADLGIADHIDEDGVVRVEELAAAAAVLPDQLLRVLRGLASFGVFRTTPDGAVAHTNLSRLLRSDVPNSMRHGARFWTAPGSWAAWGQLDAAMTGGVPHVAAWQQGRFEYLADHPDEARIFDQTMANSPDNRLPAIAAAYDFSSARVIVDVGGGTGEALRQILSRHPAPVGVVFDREDVVTAIGEDPRALLHGRITLRSGDFFHEVPAGGDVYLLLRILHDWSDADCVRILRSCRAAMTSSSVLLVGELILEPDPTRGQALDYLVDLQMMAMFGSARERTTSEFESLFHAAGFELRAVTATASSAWLIEAAPVGGEHAAR